MTIRILYKPEYKEQLIYLKNKGYLTHKITKDNNTHYIFDVYTVETLDEKKVFWAWLAKHNIKDYSIIVNPGLYIITCFEDGCDVLEY